MDLSEDLHRLIFSSEVSHEVSPEVAIVSGVLREASDNFDKIFAMVQIFEYGEYIKMKSKRMYPNAVGLPFIVSSKINHLIMMILDRLEGDFTTEILMHEDEYKLVDKMFKSMIAFYESMEYFENCARLDTIRNNFFKKTKIAPPLT